MDRDKWLMTPQTVNAYYHPLLNEIVFPAAILQPPFFTADADDAVNYGGIGAVIGHEIGHGFDDQGSKFDGSGTLRNWWTEDDRKAFEALTSKLVAQFDALSPYAAPGHNVNGKLTLGENIGDLGGLAIAYKAYLISLDGAEPEVLDGLTGEQRFFVSWAAGWRQVIRAEEAIRRLATIHTPPTSSAPMRLPGTSTPSTKHFGSPIQTACGCPRRSASASGKEQLRKRPAGPAVEPGRPAASFRLRCS